MDAQGHILIRRKAKNGIDGANGKPGEPGKDGLQGCILRQSEWAKGIEYRNDEALTSGTRYLDIAIVTTGANTFNAYKCIKTHTSSDSIPVTNTTYWHKFNSLVPVYTPLIMAQNAILRFMQGNQLLIMKEDNNTVAAGLVGGDYPLWVGATTPDNAPFKVSLAGKLYATDAVVSGEINATSGTFRNVSSANGAFMIKENGDVELVGKISTSLNGTRIVIDPETNSLKMYNQNDMEVGRISFVESEWNGTVNYLPLLRLRRYVDNVLYDEISLTNGIITCSSKVGSDIYDCRLAPSHGLTFLKNGEPTKYYLKS